MLQNHMLEMKEKVDIEGPAMIVEEIFDAVLPPKSGYARGRGPGPKPPSNAQRLAEEQRKIAGERANTAEKLNAELVTQITELKARQDEMEASIMEKM